MSRDRINRGDMDALCTHVTVDATITGLIPAGARILWHPGSEGYAPAVSVYHEGSTLKVSFLPDFTSRDTTRDAHRALAATWKVLAVLAGRHK